MSNIQALTVKHITDRGTVVFIGAISVELFDNGQFPKLMIEVCENTDRRECHGGKAYLMNASGKTIDVFDLSTMPSMGVEPKS